MRSPADEAREAHSWVSTCRSRLRAKWGRMRCERPFANSAIVSPLLIERAPLVTLSTTDSRPAVSTTKASCRSATMKLLS